MNTDDGKLKYEREVGLRAESLLKKLYGNFIWDEEQKDSPDRAIILTSPPKRFGQPKGRPIRIGVEITDVDPKEFRSYFGDTKFRKQFVEKRDDETLCTGTHPDSMNKRMKIPIPDTYIYNGAKAKAKSYAKYVESGDFDEIILLCTSHVLREYDSFLAHGLIQWTNYHLSAESFPFDKVLFLPHESFSAIQLYTKAHKLNKIPKPYDFINPSITPLDIPILRPNHTYKIKEMTEKDPLIMPKGSGATKKVKSGK